LIVLFAWIFGFSLLGSVGALAGGVVLLAFPDAIRKRLLPYLVSYASGTLLGAAFLGMIPAGIRQAPVPVVMFAVLAGIVLFFALEKLLVWRHCHQRDCEVHGQAGPLLLVGDAFHNFVDGVVIASAFLVSVPLGITVGVAVVAHEVPQEVGDFAILLDSGYGRRRALALNTLSAVATLPGAVLAYFFLAQAMALQPFVLAVAAASFIYISMADLIPGLHRRASLRSAGQQIILLMLGIATIAVIHAVSNP
jgi:zinc and cadmium transporter